MTFPAAADGLRPAVPLSPVEAAPNTHEPHALQTAACDTASPAFSAARRAANAEPRLASAFRAELRRETARFSTWREVYRRSGSGGCSHGAGPGPFQPADPAEILDRARRAVADQEAFAASPRGRLAASLTEIESATEALRAAVSETRSAIDRRDGSAPGRADAVHGLAGHLKTKAARLSRATRRVDPQPASPPTEQGEAFWRFTREICAPPPETFLSGAVLREG